MKTHDIHHRLAVENNQLIFAGKTAEEIIAIAGGTPCYVYDKSLVANRVKTLRAMLPEMVKIHYAIKANPYAPLVGQMVNHVDGFDVASHQELILALSSGMACENISFAGPGKSKQDLLAAVVSKIIINVESQHELKQIYAIAQQLQCRANIALRVNPSFELKNAGMSMAGGSKPFGIDAENITEMLQDLEFDKVNIKGLHIFTGSQNLNAEALMQAQTNTFELAYQLLKETGIKITHLNIGGGFGIPYFPNEKALNLTPVIDNLTILLEKYKPLIGFKEIHLELGRYLVGEAGIYLSRVVDKKDSRGKTFLVVDGGMHHHLANSGNFGQVIRKNYPVVMPQNMTHTAPEKINVVGPLCTPLDILANQIDLAPAKVGDVIAVLQSGAYGPTASPQLFLSQPQVKELML
jgi:diaminopimelate decarboxylase